MTERLSRRTVLGGALACGSAVIGTSVTFPSAAVPNDAESWLLMTAPNMLAVPVNEVPRSSIWSLD